MFEGRDTQDISVSSELFVCEFKTALKKLSQLKHLNKLCGIPIHLLLEPWTKWNNSLPTNKVIIDYQNTKLFKVHLDLLCG